MNPELQRNLWLEASPQRLMWVGAVLTILFGSGFAFAESLRGLDRAFAVIGGGVFIVSGLVWGPLAAGRSVANEVTQRTWDFQRLSALTPWQMAFGKLLGSTSLSWLAAATGLIALAGAMASQNRGGVLPVVIGGASLAVLLQAGSMALGLVGIRRARADGRTAALRIGCGGVIGGLILLGVIQRTLSSTIGGGDLFGGLGGSRSWWGVPVGEGFTAASLAVFAGCAVLACWRLMRLELQMQNKPWAWPGFVLFLGLYAAGFAESGLAGGNWGGRFAASGAAFGFCAYLAAFTEPADRVRARLFVRAAAQGRVDEALLKLPSPAVPLIFTVIAAIGVVASGGALPPELTGRTDIGAQSGLIALAVAAFVVRDIGVIAFFRFGPRTRRGDFGAVIGLFLLYFVGGMVGRSLGGEAGAAMFVPTLHYSGLGAAAGAVEAALIWAAAWMRIRAAEKAETA